MIIACISDEERFWEGEERRVRGLRGGKEAGKLAPAVLIHLVPLVVELDGLRDVLRHPRAAVVHVSAVALDDRLDARAEAAQPVERHGKEALFGMHGEQHRKRTAEGRTSSRSGGSQTWRRASAWARGRQ